MYCTRMVRTWLKAGSPTIVVATAGIEDVVTLVADKQIFGISGITGVEVAAGRVIEPVCDQDRSVDRGTVCVRVIEGKDRVGGIVGYV